MPTPKSTTWACDPHTLAKHDLLRMYLEAWYPILMQSPFVQRGKRLIYIEGFAGPGIYNGGEPGSPIVAARVFLRRRAFLDGGKALTMVLVEERKDRLERLQSEMATALQEFRPLPSEFRVLYMKGKCDDVILPILNRPRYDRGPVFAFLDSFGGPDVSFELARTLAALPASEVLITFGTSFLTRFGGTEAHRESGDRVFGGTHWRSVVNLDARAKKPFLVSTYRESLKAAGFRYVVSFEMYDERSNDLHLVFGTSSKTGLAKMKDAMWKVDPNRGVHFRDPRDPDQLGFDFTPTPELAPLRRFLLDVLREGDRTIGQLKENALLETVYRQPHVATAVRDMIRRGLVTRKPNSGQMTNATRISLVGTDYSCRWSEDARAGSNGG